MSTSDMSSKEYFNKIFEKFEFINNIIITDIEGTLILAEGKSQPNEKFIEKLKGPLSFLLHSAYDQLLKTEKEKLKYIITIYDSQILIQSEITQFLLIHVLSDSETCNVDVTKSIMQDIANNMNNKKIENVFQS